MVKSLKLSNQDLEMGDHLGIIIFPLVLLILINCLISLRELYKTPVEVTPDTAYSCQN